MSRVAPRKAIWLEVPTWNRWTELSQQCRVQSTQSYNNADQSVSSWMARAYRCQRRQHYTIWQYRLKAISPGGHHLLPDRPPTSTIQKVLILKLFRIKAFANYVHSPVCHFVPRVWQFSPLFPQNYFFPWCTSLPHVFWQRQRERESSTMLCGKNVAGCWKECLGGVLDNTWCFA